jgi:hypothetical protein
LAHYWFFFLCPVSSFFPFLHLSSFCWCMVECFLQKVW